jgi:tRNA(fMet)-specific endonuclease VapC
VPFLLDSNACIGLVNGRSTKLVQALAARAPTEIRLSSVVKAELLFGARRSQRIEPNLDLLRAFFAPFESVPFDDLAADHYGRLRADLAREGRLIGPNDMLIAATARAYDLILVTHNVGEFSRVPGLRWVDWEA